MSRLAPTCWRNEVTVPRPGVARSGREPARGLARLEHRGEPAATGSVVPLELLESRATLARRLPWLQLCDELAASGSVVSAEYPENSTGSARPSSERETRGGQAAIGSAVPLDLLKSGDAARKPSFQPALPTIIGDQPGGLPKTFIISFVPVLASSTMKFGDGSATRNRALAGCQFSRAC